MVHVGMTNVTYYSNKKSCPTHHLNCLCVTKGLTKELSVARKGLTIAKRGTNSGKEWDLL